MPDQEERETRKRARRDAAEGKSASTQAGEFVREEIHHIRRGEHGARSTKQAIAIGLSKARRAGVKLRAPKRGTTSARTRRQAKRDLAKGRRGPAKVSTRRSRAVRAKLRRYGHQAASPQALAQHARAVAKKRPASARKAAARKAARTRARRRR
jgi:hypothetical protein